MLRDALLRVANPRLAEITHCSLQLRVSAESVGGAHFRGLRRTTSAVPTAGLLCGTKQSPVVCMHFVFAAEGQQLACAWPGERRTAMGTLGKPLYGATEVAECTVLLPHIALVAYHWEIAWQLHRWSVLHELAVSPPKAPELSQRTDLDQQRKQRGGHTCRRS